jgi:hypothetical protein
VETFWNTCYGTTQIRYPVSSRLYIILKPGFWQVWNVRTTQCRHSIWPHPDSPSGVRWPPQLLDKYSVSLG